MTTMFACDEADMVTQGIEEQHKQLIEVTNQLYAGIATRRKIESLAVILDELLDCIHAHLSFEEYYLHRTGCRKHKTHKSVHDEVIVRVITFQTQVRAGDYEMAMDLLRFLQDWLVEHQQMDRKQVIHSKLYIEVSLINSLTKLTVCYHHTKYMGLALLRCSY